MEDQKIKTMLVDIFVQVQNVINLLNDGKYVPAWRKLIGIKDKLSYVIQNLNIKDDIENDLH